MLTERPITEITVDDVAREAGISRSLLFNYFPTKRDYHLAVIRAAARRVRRVVLVSGDEGVPVILDRFLAFLERRRDPYLSLLRGVGGADPEVAAINAQTRAELVDGILRALGRDPASPALRLAVGGWVAMVEDMGLAWAAEPAVVPREHLVDLLLGSLDDLLARST